MTETASPVRVIEETSAYWRVVFDYPPFNIVDATLFEALQNLLAGMDASPTLRVVVFESADRLLDALNSFQTALTWPETQQRIEALLKRGLQRESDFEKRWPEVLGTLLYR
jgi:enoyl-CoA hydratase/carnithine racemase